jgi:hypothetical protein
VCKVFSFKPSHIHLLSYKLALMMKTSIKTHHQKKSVLKTTQNSTSEDVLDLLEFLILSHLIFMKWLIY